jgi:MFS family permease
MEDHDPYGALRHGAFRRFLVGAQALHLGGQAIDLALGYHLYQLTGSAWSLAFMGLAKYLPIFLLSLPAGLLVDVVERRLIMRVTLTVQSLAALGLCYLSVHGGPLPLWYGLILAWSSARAVHTPASVSFYPTLIPEGSIGNAVPWNSSNFQMGAMVGPALAGFLIAWHGPEAAFLFGAAGPAFFLFMLMGISPVRTYAPPASKEGIAKRVAGGWHFVAAHKPILAALTLDLFAVLFGGVEAILPMFAKDILHVGPVGLGFMKAAPFAGAFAMSFYLAHHPMRKAGRSMLLAVAGFGLCMAVFGLSTIYAVSLMALFLSGVLDNISVVVRQTLVQVTTPEGLRGRVQAVNFLFIGSSNELGEFESGVAAASLGAVSSVLAGGVVVLLVVAAVAWKWPQLRELGSLSQTRQESKA